MSDLEWLASHNAPIEIGKVYLDCDMVTLHEAEPVAPYGPLSNRELLGREVGRAAIRDGHAERLPVIGSRYYQAAAWYGDQLMWMWEATYLVGGPASFLSLPPFPLEVTCS